MTYLVKFLEIGGLKHSDYLGCHSAIIHISYIDVSICSSSHRESVFGTKPAHKQ
jgi:hypothetical protein